MLTLLVPVTWTSYVVQVWKHYSKLPVCCYGKLDDVHGSKCVKQVQCVTKQVLMYYDPVVQYSEAVGGAKCVH